MTDAPKKPLKRMTMFSVSSNEFVRFLVAKGGNETERCPVCSGEEWTVLCPNDGGPTLRLGMPVRNREKTFYLSTFGYYCVNCGFLRTHMASVVHKWVEENPAVDTDLADDDSAESDTDGE
ncbi:MULTISPECIES: hypothetical protein [Pseudomonas]|nr:MULTISPECIES: hypothetical protein [Pseudomonas]NNA42457.1 hypothetical protein [Pseudomonas lundensis]